MPAGDTPELPSMVKVAELRFKVPNSPDIVIAYTVVWALAGNAIARDSARPISAIVAFARMRLRIDPLRRICSSDGFLPPQMASLRPFGGITVANAIGRAT